MTEAQHWSYPFIPNNGDKLHLLMGWTMLDQVYQIPCVKIPCNNQVIAKGGAKVVLLLPVHHTQTPTFPNMLNKRNFV